MRQAASAGIVLLVVAGLAAGVGYVLGLPRPLVVAGLICFVAGTAVALVASFANARREHESLGRSAGRAIKDTIRLVLDLVP